MKWKKIKGCDYEVSESGMVRSIKRVVINSKGIKVKYKSVLLKPIKIANGYLAVNIYKNRKRKLVYIHRIVGYEFLKGRIKKNKVINHKDGIKTNNDRSNLEWVTISENVKHAYKIGLHSQKNEKNANAKLTLNEVLEIRKKGKSGINPKDIQKDYKVCLSSIQRILRGASWSV